MRRGLTAGLTSIACLLLLAGGEAVAEETAPADGSNASAEFNLRGSNGFFAEFESSGRHVTLTVRGTRRYVVYQVTGEVLERSVEASFGELGRISLRFHPTKTLSTSPVPSDCTGRPWTTEEGAFFGSAAFRGERGYTTIDVHRVKGTVRTSPEWDCPDEEQGPLHPGPLPDRAPGAAPRPIAAPATPRAPAALATPRPPTALASARTNETRESEIGVLRARDGAGRGFLALGGVAEKGNRKYALFSAGLSEQREGIRIGRGAYAIARDGRFAYDHDAGTATVRPPAPFSGHASLVRHGNAKQAGTWLGTLTVSLLGHDPIHLAGPTFSATLNRDVPGD